MNETVMNQTLGFGHFVAQSDAVGRTILAILVVMSIASWYLIVTKSIANWLQRRRSHVFLDKFWNATSLDAVAHEISTHGAKEPFSHLASHALFAREHHAKFGASRLEEMGSSGEFLTRAMRKVMDEETAQLESGLSLLASVGATAPFVGLFGTVWGVYHALIAIGLSGSGTLDKVAGPVGEALIMTGIGLAVAIPAVLGYNYFQRSNRILLAKLDAFAYDLFNFLATGHPLDAGSNVHALRRNAGDTGLPAKPARA